MGLPVLFFCLSYTHQPSVRSVFLRLRVPQNLPEPLDSSIISGGIRHSGSYKLPQTPAEETFLTNIGSCSGSQSKENSSLSSLTTRPPIVRVKEILKYRLVTASYCVIHRRNTMNKKFFQTFFQNHNFSGFMPHPIRGSSLSGPVGVATSGCRTRPHVTV